jgi:hypothetical protein
MTFDTTAWIMDGTTVDAEVIRRALGTLLGSAGGIVTPGDLQVTQQASPNMSVLVGTGQIWVPGTSTASQGMYYSRNGAAVTLAIAASNPSNPRIDTVVVQVQDAAYAGATKSIAPAVITGTPTSGATLANLTGAGAAPASSTVLAYVLVPAGATTIVTADIANVASQVAAASLNPGPWTPLTLGAGHTGYVPSARLLSVDTVQLKGAPSAGGPTGAGFVWATIPATTPTMRPSTALSFGYASDQLEIATNGQITFSGTVSGVGLDGITYTLS